MITLETWLHLIGYQITEGSDYYDPVYPNGAYALDRWERGIGTVVVFSKATQKVYQAQLHDYVNRKSYRWVAPEYVNLVDTPAYDGVEFQALNSEQFIEKLKELFPES